MSFFCFVDEIKPRADVSFFPELASHLSSPDSTTTTDATSATTLSKRKSLLGRRVSLRSKRDSTASAAARSPTTTTLSVPPGLSPASASPSPYASAAPSRAQSRNPSTVSLSKTPPDGPPTTTTTDPEAARMLAEVWLASAASFRRAGKLEESRGAISEAERLDPSNPNVWSQVSSYTDASGTMALMDGKTKPVGIDRDCQRRQRRRSGFAAESVLVPSRSPRVDRLVVAPVPVVAVANARE